VFVDVGAERPGLVHVSEMSSEYVQDPSDLVQVGEEVDVSVIDVDRKKRQIRFSMKDAVLEVIEEEEDLVEETPTAMELALREALEQSDERPEVEQAATDDKSKKKAKHRKDEIEDILSRTLKQRVKTASSNE
jgi:transcriptional accessory protein Tex/SPT6